jgi:hypothetical protein
MKMNWNDLKEHERLEMRLQTKFRKEVKKLGFIDSHDVLSHWLRSIHYWRKRWNEDTKWRKTFHNDKTDNPLDTKCFDIELLPCKDGFGFIPPMSIAAVWYKGTYDEMYKKLLDLIDRPNGDTKYLHFYINEGFPIIL